MQEARVDANDQTGMVFNTKMVEADISHPASMSKVGIGQDGKPQMVTVFTGGFSKPLAIAKDLLPVFLERRGGLDKEAKYHNWNVEEAVELALATAQCLIDREKLKRELLGATAQGLVLQ